MSLEQLGLQAGDEVDIWRKPSAKDMGGWIGPCEVTSLNDIKKGHILVRHQRDIMEVYHPHIRRHLAFPVWFLSQNEQNRYSTPAENAWRHLRGAIDRMAPSALITVGHVRDSQGNWQISRATSQHAGLLSAIQYFFLTQLRVQHVVLARVGHGIRHLPKVSGYDKCILLTWLPGQQYPTIMYPEGTKEGYTPQIRLDKEDPERWTHLRVVQVFMSDDFR